MNERAAPAVMACRRRAAERRQLTAVLDELFL
jgi:hypothetical protein